MTKMRSSVPTYSMRLIRPFLLALRGRVLPTAMAELERVDLDARIPIGLALKLLEDAIATTGDADLGLKAARIAEQGDYDLLEYAIVSSPTVRDGHEVLRRHVQLLNTALEYSLDVQLERAICRFSSRISLRRSLPRAATDFQLAAFHHASLRWFPPLSGFKSEVWFTYTKPADTSEHVRSFGAAELHFEASADAIVFPTEYLELRMPHADPKLHALLQRQIEERLIDLPSGLEFRRQVRKLISLALVDGKATAGDVATRLNMSRRTLTRHLLRQGASFKALLDEVRREHAEHALVREGGSVGEISERLGYAEPAAFHKAFRRWTGMTPAQYRRRNWHGPSGVG
jgi:AraC-like DNA-binding protein